MLSARHPEPIVRQDDHGKLVTTPAALVGSGAERIGQRPKPDD
jgi:hypothetical protein